MLHPGVEADALMSDKLSLVHWSQNLSSVSAPARGNTHSVHTQLWFA